MGRPRRLLRWAYGSGAKLVEPSSGKAAVGYLDGEMPPAGWFNAHLHLTGAWLGYLRGPNLGNWTRANHAALDPFDAGKFWRLAADTTTLDTDLPIYRYALLGEVSGSPALRASRRGIGAGWVERSLPAMAGEARGVAFVGRWLVWGAAANKLWSTIADDSSGDSAVGTDDATKWTAVSLSTGLAARGAAWCAGATGRAAGARQAVVVCEGGSPATFSMLVSTDDGATWTSRSQAWGGSAYAPDVAHDPTRDVFVIVSGRAAVAVSAAGAPGDAWTVRAGPGIHNSGDAFRVRCGGGTWITFAPNGTPMSTPVMYRSRDAGVTWESLTTALPREPGTSAPAVMRDLAYADGVWVMCVADAPFLYASHDDGDTWERVALPIGEEGAWDLFGVIYADGQVLASGLAFCVASGRAMGTSDGAMVPDTTPSILSDAYRIRGGFISTTAPGDGEALVWDAGLSQWVPTAVSTWTTPTTTRGDLIRRGASADERLPLGTRGYVLRAGATDPGWAALQVSDSSVPTAGSDYAGVVYWRTDLGAHWMCTKGGAANTHAWRVLSLFDGDVAGAPTSDATWTTVALTTIPTDTVALLAVEVVGVKSDGSDALTASGRAGWANASGALVEIEPLTLLIGDDTRVRLDPSGTTLRAQVLGVVSEDWTWRVSITRRLEVSL